MGGNAAVMAERAYKEKIGKILLAAEMSSYYYETLFDNNIELVDEAVTEFYDVHLVMNY